jgi:hypothetical protein
MEDVFLPFGKMEGGEPPALLVIPPPSDDIRERLLPSREDLLQIFPENHNLRSHE